MKRKILLINPPYPFEESPAPPLGLSYLAAYLLKEGHDVKIADFVINPYSEQKLTAILEELKPDTIGATGVTMNIKSSIKILEACSFASPHAAIALGGPHATFDADNILKQNPFIDFIVRGEGEITLSEALSAATKNLASVRGISFRYGDKIIHNEPRPFIEDLNVLPMPARHLIELSKYRALGMPVNMITSKGCPFDCIFCVGSKMVGKKVRYYDVERVVDEFELLSALGFKQINIVDDLFTSNKKRCLAICDEIQKRGIKHTWTAFARVDTVSRELLSAMKEAGCTMLCFGIESGSQKILDAVKKKTNLALCRQAVDLCNEAGIEPMASYILGLPGESPDTVKDTLKFASKLNRIYGFHILSPFPGTEVRDRAGDFRLKILTDDWDMYDANHVVCEPSTISKENIEDTYREFNERIEKYIHGAVEKYDSGSLLPEPEMAMVKNIKSVNLIRKIIDMDLIGMYPGTDENCQNTQAESLARFIADETENNDKLLVSELVRRLISERSIEFYSSGDLLRARWAR